MLNNNAYNTGNIFKVEHELKIFFKFTPYFFIFSLGKLAYTLERFLKQFHSLLKQIYKIIFKHILMI